MTELKHTSELVKALLESDEKCRNSDSYLYMRVLSVIGEKREIDLRGITIFSFLMNMHGTVFPVFETVRRARQKVQEHHPELGPCPEVAEYRIENEAEYLAFARGEI